MNALTSAFVSITLAVGSLAPAATWAASQDKAPEYKAFKTSQIKWSDAPSVGPGAKIAILEGDLKAAGPFTFRLKVPPHSKIGVHTHPTDERVTMLGGTLYFATGEKYEPKKAIAFKAGDTFIVPQGVPMFAYTKDKEAVAQIHGTGPWGITYKNPEDDPKAKKK